MTKRPEVEPIRQPSLFGLEPFIPASPVIIERTFSLPDIFLGTSSFTATGWEGSFYPQGMRSKDFLRHYATQFQTVEIDSTFYGTPAASTVISWNKRTPQDFIFAVKIPQVITHEKVLVDCEPEFDEFIERMHLLGDKLGPMLWQFPKFDKWVLKSPDEFRGRLQSFRRLETAASATGIFLVRLAMIAGGVYSSVSGSRHQEIWHGGVENATCKACDYCAPWNARVCASGKLSEWFGRACSASEDPKERSQGMGEYQ